jgi:ketosteroid isomerase-like protein
MSQENVEVMRRLIAAFNSADGEAFDGFLTSDAEVVPVRAALEGTIYRGPDAGTQYCTAVDQSWENLRWEVEEIREGGDWVLALGHIQGEGRDSGAAIDARGGWLANFTEGRIARFQTFANRADALEAAGLSE